jgi:TatD DNase family protein
MTECSDPSDYFRDFCGSGFEAVLTQGCDQFSIEDTKKLAFAHPKIFASFGCHPKSAWLYEDENLEELCLAAFRECGKKAVAWGEFGLDYSNENWGEDEEYQNTQIRVFERQLDLAIERSLPMVLHIRTAADDAFRILRKKVPSHWKAHIHSFHGPTWFVTKTIEYFPNFFYGITGTVSMEGDGTRMARIVPLERMVLETDGPYMVPRGTTFNHVGQIPLIARMIAKARNCDSAEVFTKCRANSRLMYGV